MLALLAPGLTLSAGATRADGTLTIQLPPSQRALESRAAAAQAASAARKSQPVYRYRAPLASRGRMVWRKTRSEERLIGRLGQLMQNVAIHRARSVRSTALVTAPSGTYVAIKAQEDGWCGVLMADGSIGWLPEEDVRPLSYEVVAAQPNWTSQPQSGAMPADAEAGDTYPRTSAPFFAGDAQVLLAEAYKYLGVPYLWGGNTANGIDCSGFVKKVFGACGYQLPRLGTDQMAYGVPVPVNQLQAGDRLYFERRSDGRSVGHTGLYIGNGYFIHSSSSRHGVAISRLTEPLWSRIFVCARR